MMAPMESTDMISYRSLMESNCLTCTVVKLWVKVLSERCSPLLQGSFKWGKLKHAQMHTSGSLTDPFHGPPCMRNPCTKWIVAQERWMVFKERYVEIETRFGFRVAWGANVVGLVEIARLLERLHKRGEIRTLPISEVLTEGWKLKSPSRSPRVPQCPQRVWWT